MPQVTATCQVAGKYAQTGPNNWPAQLLICGSPPGSSYCTRAAYNSSLPILLPNSVTYDGSSYTASYAFQVSNAWIAPQPITYRYFICLYDNSSGSVSQRSGASLDVVSDAARALGVPVLLAGMPWHSCTVMPCLLVASWA